MILSVASELRIRVEFNKGRVGMPLDKLVSATGHTERFLELLARDLNLGAGGHVWLAERFENASIDFDCRYAVALEPERVSRGQRALRQIFTNHYDDTEVAVLIRPDTRRQFARIADPLDADETAQFGLYGGGNGNPTEWFTLTKDLSAEIAEPAVMPRESWGEVQGVVHSFFKEVEQPYLKIRELSTRQLVNCYFKREMYQAAVDVLNDPEAVVFVEGRVREDAETGLATEIEVMDFRLAPEFILADYEAALGSQPGYTEELSTGEFINNQRDE